jgi:hypothetical protein
MNGLLIYFTMTNQFQQQFIRSEIYKDIGDYKNLSLLALSKKLPYWKKIRNKEYNGVYNKVVHLRNFCRDCDKDIIFVVTLSQTFDGHYKPFTDYNERFWIYYKEQSKKLYVEALEHYTDVSNANENVRCPCGGHYTRVNKGKHFKTKKHLKCELVI